MVTHADGSLVTASNPAKAGEQVVAYAVGLGRTSPQSETGKVVKTSAPTQTRFSLDFNYRANALAKMPPPANTEGAPQPVYSGTVAGTVSLYQINFVGPTPAPGTPRCDPAGQQTPGRSFIYSNLTVTVGGIHSFDAAQICVEPLE